MCAPPFVQILLIKYGISYLQKAVNMLYYRQLEMAYLQEVNMEIYDTKKEAIKAMNGRDLRLVKVSGGWALMEWREYAIWLKQRGYD